MHLTPILLRITGLVITAAVLLTAGPAISDEKAPIETRESELKRLNSRIETIRSELADSERRRQALSDELRETERQIAAVISRLRKLEKDIEGRRERLRALEKALAKEQHQLNRHREALSRQLRAAYAMGRQERLKIMLNQQDPAVISRMLVYYDYFNRARRESIENIDRGIEQLRRTEAAISLEERQLVEAQETQRQGKVELDANRKARAPILAALSEEIEDKSERLHRLEGDAKELRRVIDRLQQERLALPMDMESSKPFGKLKGKLMWPARGRLTARFGTKKEGNLKWEGVLLSAPEGEAVRAVHHGRVAFADWLRGFGLLIIVDHGDGYMTLYGHNESLFKDTGEWVEPGETIGAVGVTGGRSKPGAYFGIRHNGRPVDPKRWCRRIKGNRVGRAPSMEEGIPWELPG